MKADDCGMSTDYPVCDAYVCDYVFCFDELLLSLAITSRSNQFYFSGIDIGSARICESLQRGSSYEG